jgi:hypothetical protein
LGWSLSTVFSITSNSASCHHDPVPLFFFGFFAGAGFVAGVLTFFLIVLAGLTPVERAASFDDADGADE